jgi:hypothetical protein
MPHVVHDKPSSCSDSPQGLRPVIKQLIEALARDAVRRENRRAREVTLEEAREPEDK